jgi:hypothetical protein
MRRPVASPALTIHGHWARAPGRTVLGNTPYGPVTARFLAMADDDDLAGGHAMLPRPVSQIRPKEITFGLTIGVDQFTQLMVIMVHP